MNNLKMILPSTIFKSELSICLVYFDRLKKFIDERFNNLIGIYLKAYPKK